MGLERGFALEPVSGQEFRYPALGDAVAAGDFGLRLAGQDGCDHETLLGHAPASTTGYADDPRHPIPMS